MGMEYPEHAFYCGVDLHAKLEAPCRPIGLTREANKIGNAGYRRTAHQVFGPQMWQAGRAAK